MENCCEMSGSFRRLVSYFTLLTVPLTDLFNLGASNGKCETLRDGETDTFSASPRLP